MKIEEIKGIVRAQIRAHEQVHDEKIVAAEDLVDSTAQAVIDALALEAAREHDAKVANAPAETILLDQLAEGYKANAKESLRMYDEELQPVIAEALDLADRTNSGESGEAGFEGSSERRG